MTVAVAFPSTSLEALQVLHQASAVPDSTDVLVAAPAHVRLRHTRGMRRTTFPDGRANPPEAAT